MPELVTAGPHQNKLLSFQEKTRDPATTNRHLTNARLKTLEEEHHGENAQIAHEDQGGACRTRIEDARTKNPAGRPACQPQSGPETEIRRVAAIRPARWLHRSRCTHARA